MKYNTEAIPVLSLYCRSQWLRRYLLSIWEKNVPPKPEVTEPWGPGHISLVRFLLTVTKILGNEDGKPIKVLGGH